MRARVSKTRRRRWVELPDDLFSVVVDRLPAREDRNLAAPLFPVGTTDHLRMAVDRACRTVGVPDWTPHELRHRRISLMHQNGLTWAEIGANVGQRNLSVTADRYTHVLLDPTEVDRSRLLERVQTVQPVVQSLSAGNALFAGAS